MISFGYMRIDDHDHFGGYVFEYFLMPDLDKNKPWTGVWSMYYDLNNEVTP